jgi:hypothetical protein
MKNTSKNCTDIEQSKKLIELGIDVKTADMYYSHEFVNSAGDYYKLNFASEGYFDDEEILGSDIPAWTLSALIDLMPHEITIKDDGTPYRLLVTHNLVHYPRLTTMWPSIYSVEANTTLDAAFEVICELLEDKII